MNVNEPKFLSIDYPTTSQLKSNSSHPLHLIQAQLSLYPIHLCTPAFFHTDINK